MGLNVNHLKLLTLYMKSKIYFNVRKLVEQNYSKAVYQISMFNFAETGQVFSLAQAERCHNQLKGPFGLGSAGAFW